MMMMMFIKIWIDGNDDVVHAEYDDVDDDDSDYDYDHLDHRRTYSRIISYSFFFFYLFIHPFLSLFLLIDWFIF